MNTLKIVHLFGTQTRLIYKAGDQIYNYLSLTQSQSSENNKKNIKIVSSNPYDMKCVLFPEINHTHPNFNPYKSIIIHCFSTHNPYNVKRVNDYCMQNTSFGLDFNTNTNNNKNSSIENMNVNVFTFDAENIQQTKINHLLFDTMRQCHCVYDLSKDIDENMITIQQFL